MSEPPDDRFVLQVIGVVRSELTDPADAPKQGQQGAPDAWIDLDERAPLRGVFSTRSQSRPNPIGIHPVTVRAVEGRRLRVGPLELVDGTPALDIEPVI